GFQLSLGVRFLAEFVQRFSNTHSAVLAVAFEWHFDQHGVRTVSNRLHDRIVDAFIHEGSTNRVIVRSLFETRGNYRSAFEINAEVERLMTSGLPDHSRSQTGQHKQNGNADKPTAVTHPVNIYIVKNLKHDDSLDTQ